MKQILFPNDAEFWYETQRSFEKIACPALICDAANDLYFEGQAKLLFDHLTCPKTFLEFSAEEGADAHCQVGAARLAMGRIYNLLDDTLASHTATEARR
jgi:hypothetical protein